MDFLRPVPNAGPQIENLWRLCAYLQAQFLLFGIFCRYLEVLLRRVTCNVGQIIYSPNQKAFVSLSVDGQQVPFAAEEYADLIGRLYFTPFPRQI